MARVHTPPLNLPTPVSRLLATRVKSTCLPAYTRFFFFFFLSRPPWGGHRYSTGFLPLKIPLAFLLNIPLCFIPFSDNKIIRTTWMPGIRNRLEHKAIVQEGSDRYKI